MMHQLYGDTNFQKGFNFIAGFWCRFARLQILLSLGKKGLIFWTLFIYIIN
jgi:hypothetical protein